MKKEVRLLIPKEEIIKRVEELGARISSDYAGKSVTVLILANGGIFFGVDLLRAIKGISVFVECIRVSSYKNGTSSSGDPEIFGRLSVEDFQDNHILIVDDIIDTGNTLNRIREQIENFGAASVKICTLLDKPSRRVADIAPDYCGFRIEDRFVVGYGLDYSGKYRELPFIGFIE